MSSTNLAVNPTPNKNQTIRVLGNRWFVLGVGVLIASIVLMLTLDMQLYAVSMVAGLMGIALAGYFIAHHAPPGAVRNYGWPGE